MSEARLRKEDLAPITLVYGDNGAGKSQLIENYRATTPNAVRVGGEGCLAFKGPARIREIARQLKELRGKGLTIIIDQPEIGLHPKLQAELGDLLILAITGGNFDHFLNFPEGFG